MNVNDIHELAKFQRSPVGTQIIPEMALVGSAVLEELQKTYNFELDLSKFRRPNVRSLRAKATKTYNI